MSNGSFNNCSDSSFAVAFASFESCSISGIVSIMILFLATFAFLCSKILRVVVDNVVSLITAPLMLRGSFQNILSSTQMPLLLVQIMTE